MNKTAIKNYAIWARVQLIEAAKQRAFEYAITDGENDPNLEIINGRILSSEEKNQRAELITLIKQKGFEQVMEEAAYTWFNRFIALRFMEVNGYLPTKVRVFTDENNEFKPQILKEAMTVDLNEIDREKILSLIEKQDNEELFKYLIIAQCNALSFGLPGMFETISNWTELLFPANLLKADSVIGQMITNIPEEDWTDQVQIIGWLYQYYNSELKDDTFAKLKKNIKISKERIPAATQLFTPDWIVRYMVENSLGRLWYEGHPDFDKTEWKYYLDEAEQESEVEEVLKKIRAEYAQIKPEEIKIIDPCMGSGHILVYAFDVLMQIYTSVGWSERDAAKSILEHNLFGLDIDDRAGQLAYFAVMMKARKYNRRILNGEVRPKVLAIQESNGIDVDLNKLGPEKAIGEKLLKDLRDAKEYGSILNLKVTQKEIDALKLRLEDVDRMASYGSLLTQYESWRLVDSLYPLIEQAEVMVQKYDVVVTNPPYMGASGMSPKLSKYVKDNYPDSKNDLFAVFIEKWNSMINYNCYNCMVTMQSWMFLSSYESMRLKVMKSKMIINLMHMDNMVMHIAFGTAVTCFRNNIIKGYRGTYIQIKTKDIIDESIEKPKTFPVKNNRFAQVSTDYFSNIPGSPIAYWLSQPFINAFENGVLLGTIADSKQGIATADNNRFLRLWAEVDYCKFKADSSSSDDAKHSGKKWFPYNKGGDFRRWYGNNDYLVNWFEDGYEIKHIFDENGKLRSRPQNLEFMFKPCASWSLVSSGSAAFRYKPLGQLFDVGGMSFFSDKYLLYLLALCNTKFVYETLKVLAPTINFQCGDIANIPVFIDEIEKPIIEDITSDCITLSKSDWDSFETSWDFKKHPLI